MTDGKVVSYILVMVIPGSDISFWKYGEKGGWTQDIKEARRYARKFSANSARRKLLKRSGMPDPAFFRVETITE